MDARTSRQPLPDRLRRNDFGRGSLMRGMMSKPHRSSLIALGLAMAVLSCCAMVFQDQAHARSEDAVANDARLAGDKQRTRFIADLSTKVDVHVFALADPYRVIIDLPNVSFQLPEGVGKEKRGLVTAYRFGLFAPGKSRIVLDVDAPFLIDKAFVLDARDEQPARLVVDLVPTDEKSFQESLAATPERTSSVAPPPAPEAAAVNAKPVVVLDPGHGGIDPGTQSASGITEKEVVLAFAKKLKERLEESGRYQVYLTRDDDTFLALRERVEFAQGKGADLFISIHADYFSGKQARGAAVYTLSEKASSEEAKALAAKENLSDSIAGVELSDDEDGLVANILIDLTQRETQNRSAILAHSVIGELKEKSPLTRKTIHSAGFRVLKAPDIPSVLLELGFLSNEQDEKRLTSDSWRETMAEAVGKAVDNYFNKRMARVPY
jgi:N-acetylmuramoyl-L-alanine amidase